MSCKKCTTTTTFPEDQNKIAAFASHEYMLEKLSKAFENTCKIINYGEYLIIYSNFDKFIQTIISVKEFTQMELENIDVIPLKMDEEPTFGSYKKSKSLYYYINLYYSADLKWILDNESIITYFQPIVKTDSLDIFAYECLSRGLKKDSSIMPPNLMFESARKTEMIFNLDRQCRLSALKNAKKHNINKKIFINFAPTSIYNPVFCLRDTVRAAEDLNFDFSQIVFEVVESERVENIAHLKNIIDFYIKKGFEVALDDVGSGYSSLNLLAEIKPNVIKIDMNLIRNIDKDPAKKAIVNSLVFLSKELNSVTLAEGVESKTEYEIIKNMNIDLAQGYFFAKPSPEPILSIR